MENKRPATDSLPAPKLPKLASGSKVVQEADVGITQYISGNAKSGSFVGTLKQRYSDFQVNEIGLDGQVVHLLDDGVDLGKSKKERRIEQRGQARADLQEKTPEEVEEIKKEMAAPPKYTLSDENRQKLLELLKPEELSQIEELFSTGGNMETTTTFADKGMRTQLHILLRGAFLGKLETLTSDSQTFKIALAKGTPSRRNNNDRHHVDEKGVVNFGLGAFKNYLHFTVYKENRETMEVASTIARFLRVPNRSVKYAGTKDRRGVTCQRFAIHKGKVARVNSLNNGLRGAVLGGFKYEDRNLDLGDLQGNEFVIAIRDARPLEEGQSLDDVVGLLFSLLEKHGFINYYGLQRFGTFSVSTHELGIILLKEDWEAAAQLILAEQDRVLPDSVEARRVWAETHDASEAASKMPRRCAAEHAILTNLAKQKRPEAGYTALQYLTAIMQIPRNLRLIYVHAYQSYVWNMVASKRIDLFGLEVQVGDLVLVSPEEQRALDVVDGVEFAEDVADLSAPKARALNSEDIASGKFSIYDVVLPSPGYDVVYPLNPDIMEVYEKVMAKDGLSPYKMASRIKEFSLGGAYRALVGRAEGLSYEIIKYTEDTDLLLYTDLELMKAKQDGKEISNRVIPQTGDNEKTAVILQMRLGVSAYATMALREFMKVDTSRLSATFVKEQEKEAEPEAE